MQKAKKFLLYSLFSLACLVVLLFSFISCGIWGSAATSSTSQSTTSGTTSGASATATLGSGGQNLPSGKFSNTEALQFLYMSYSNIGMTGSQASSSVTSGDISVSGDASVALTPSADSNSTQTSCTHGYYTSASSSTSMSQTYTNCADISGTVTTTENGEIDFDLSNPQSLPITFKGFTETVADSSTNDTQVYTIASGSTIGISGPGNNFLDQLQNLTITFTNFSMTETDNGTPVGGKITLSGSFNIQDPNFGTTAQVIFSNYSGIFNNGTTATTYTLNGTLTVTSATPVDSCDPTVADSCGSGETCDSTSGMCIPPSLCSGTLTLQGGSDSVSVTCPFNHTPCSNLTMSEIQTLCSM